MITVVTQLPASSSTSNPFQFLLSIVQFGSPLGYIISLFTASQADSTNQNVQKILRCETFEIKVVQTTPSTADRLSGGEGM